MKTPLPVNPLAELRAMIAHHITRCRQDGWLRSLFYCRQEQLVVEELGGFQSAASRKAHLGEVEDAEAEKLLQDLLDHGALEPKEREQLKKAAAHIRSSRSADSQLCNALAS